MHANRILPALVVVLGITGALLIANGAFISIKAALAQALLERSWQVSLASDGVVDLSAQKPWPWADTWPVARLDFLKAGRRMVVLHGTSGEALAFGPGHLSASPLPGDLGNSIIAAHRDTHFSFLRELKYGDQLWVERANGQRWLFEVNELRVVHETDPWATRQSPTTELTLVTCFPFDSLETGGPWRYVARAQLVDVI